MSFRSRNEASDSPNRKPKAIKIHKTAIKRAQTAMQTPRAVKKHYITKQRSPTDSQPIPSYMSKTAPKKTKPPLSTKSLLKNQACISLRDQLYSNPDFTEIETAKLNLLLGHLKEYSSYCALCCNYPEAKKSDQLAKQIKAELISRSFRYISEDKENEKLEIEKEKEIKKQQQERERFEEKYQRRRDAFIKSQEKQYQEFEESWNNEIPRRYRKSSPQLLVLLKTEKKFVRNGEYDAASNIRKEIEAQQKIEMEQAQNLLNSDYVQARDALIRTQQEELELFDHKYSHRRELLQIRQKEDFVPIMNRENLLANKPVKPISPDFRSTSGNVSRLYHDLMNPDALLPPLLAPNDERNIQRQRESMKLKIKKDKELIKRLQQKDQEKEEKFQNWLKTLEENPSVFQTQNHKTFEDNTTSSPKVLDQEDTPKQPEQPSNNENGQNPNEPKENEQSDYSSGEYYSESESEQQKSPDTKNTSPPPKETPKDDESSSSYYYSD